VVFARRRPPCGLTLQHRLARWRTAVDGPIPPRSRYEISIPHSVGRNTLVGRGPPWWVRNSPVEPDAASSDDRDDAFSPASLRPRTISVIPLTWVIYAGMAGMRGTTKRGEHHMIEPPPGRSRRSVD